MLANISFFAWTIVIMTGLAALGGVGGFVLARVRMNRFLKVFNEDVKKPAFQKLPN